MATTFTQDIFATRAVDTVHINPSMMEGERFYTSMLGPNRAVRIDRYAPVNLNVPTISGPPEIPGTLVCFPGVWDSSPQPAYSFQWLSDGVAIDGATGSSFETYPSLDSTEITCEVTATNIIDTATLETPVGIVVTIIEPIDVWEQDFYVIQGLNQLGQQNHMVYRNLVVTGMWVEDRADIMSNVWFAATGMWVENRFDTMTFTQAAITGIGFDQTDILYSFETYAVTIPDYLEDLTIVNPGAETGDLTGWTASVGTPEVIGTGGHTGTYFFSGGQTSDSAMYQRIDLNNSADIDAGLIAFSMSAFFKSGGFYDYIQMYYQFSDDNGVTSPQFSLIRDLYHPPSSWERQISATVDVPPGSRYVTITVNFDNQILGGVQTYFDDVSAQLFKY